MLIINGNVRQFMVTWLHMITRVAVFPKSKGFCAFLFITIKNKRTRMITSIKAETVRQLNQNKKCKMLLIFNIILHN